MPVDLILGDVLEVTHGLSGESFTACFCDPPYGLSFMGKEWDHGVPSKEVWVEILRLLKPGAVLMAFGGTRTWHRLAVAIEDAGFELFDTMMYLYGQGFPKGHNVAWAMHKQACALCGAMVQYDYEETESDASGNESPPDTPTGSESQAEHSMRFVRATYLQTPVYACAECGQVLQPFMPQQGTQEHRTSWTKSQTVWPEQSSMEGRSDLEAPEGQLQRCQVCTLSSGVYADGTQGWLCDGASGGDGAIPWQMPEEDGSRPSYRPQSREQFHQQLEAFRLERAAQAFRGYNVNPKPAWEPILLARKPRRATYAQTAREHGTACLNIDRCRVGTHQTITRVPEIRFTGRDYAGGKVYKPPSDKVGDYMNPPGRWPANLLLSHSDCERVGVKRVKATRASNIRTDSGGMFVAGGVETLSGAADPDGLETVAAYRCSPDCPVAMLDRQSGVRPGFRGFRVGAERKASRGKGGYHGNFPDVLTSQGHNDTGGASRFFQTFERFYYCAKASRKERDRGLEGLEGKGGGSAGIYPQVRQCLKCGTRAITPGPHPVLNCKCDVGFEWVKARKDGHKGLARNPHPTVKPLALCEYLARLIVPPPEYRNGAQLLVPFCGSGSEIIGALKAGWRNVTGIDILPEYLEIARLRIAAYTREPQQMTLGGGCE